MDTLKKRLAEENDSLNSLALSLNNMQASVWLRNLLESKRKTEKKLFEEFQDQQEQKAEEIVATWTPTTSIPIDPIEMPLLEKLLKTANSKDDLSADVVPFADSDFSEDNEAVATIYEEPEEDAEVILSEQQAKENLGTQESFALNIVLNEKQLIAKEMAFAGKSFVMIGPAGSGKTTGQRAVAEALLQAGSLSTTSFKTYTEGGERKYVSAPSIAFCAFTRRAAANLQKAIFKSPLLAEELKHNIMTIHSLLEFEPETYMDYTDGEAKEKFRFAPKRTADNPLSITHLVIEESSMLDAMTLWGYLYDALPRGVQIIFIGDINQLPPVFGPSILNYALVQLPIVELDKVYRNQGIVLENAHRILKGETLLENDNFIIVRGNKPVQLGQENLSRILGNLFNQWLDMKGNDGLPEYDPEDCMILSPWNKNFLGTDNLNAWIAQHLGARRNAIVHEVIAGFSKLYLAVGDRVMVNKMDGVITEINRNASYHGREPQFPGSDLTRFGMRILAANNATDLDELSLDYSNFSLDNLADEKAERKQQCSHVITVACDNGKTEVLSAAGDFSGQSFSLGYALTVHKAQGSEWRKVFIILHKDHAVSLYRELFYTAVTRARTKVTIISKDTVIEKALKNQRIKGNSTADKIEFFNSGVMDSMKEPIYATK